jgi:small subunit ribosomal protein S21
MTEKQYNYNSQHSNRYSKGGDTPAEPHTPIQAKPLEIKVGDNFDKAFKIFRAVIQKERIVSTLKEKSGYEKPSVKRRRKQAENKRKRAELDGKRSRNEKSDKPRIKVLRETKKDLDGVLQ